MTRIAPLVLLGALTLTTGACGEEPTERPSAVRTASNGDVHNGADVQFAGDMIQHHAQALEMVDLTVGRELDPEVADLADRIRAAQAPEVEQMVDWLTAWGEEVPETSLDHANAHGGGTDEHGGGDHEMPGMMSADEMAELEAAPDSAFEQRWLEMMLEHHEGAVEMARAEREDGEFEGAIALAESIETSQQAEIEEIQELLG